MKIRFCIYDSLPNPPKPVLVAGAAPKAGAGVVPNPVVAGLAPKRLLPTVVVVVV